MSTGTTDSRRRRRQRLALSFVALLVLLLPGCCSVPVVPITFSQARTLEGRPLPPEREYWLSFRSPSQFNSTGLYFLQPYQRGKIPVIMIHGVASDAYTWDDIIFSLQADARIAERYQFWVYQYPTGLSYLRSAGELRKELLRVRSEIDPSGSDSAIDQTVLIGHSMGGLLAKLQVSHSEDQIWRAVSNLPMEETLRTQPVPESTVNALVFEPVPYVRRVVYMATPHLGSNWTLQPLGRFGRWLIDIPQQVQDDWRVLVRGSVPDRRDPTSLDHLTPGDPVILATNRLRRSGRVHENSIIGDGYLVPDGYIGDGVVPVISARHANSETEYFVRATHSAILRAPSAMTELTRILLSHADSPTP